MKPLNGPFPGKMQLFLRQYDRKHRTEKMLRSIASLPGINSPTGVVLYKDSLSNLTGRDNLNTDLSLSTLVKRGYLLKLTKYNDPLPRYRASGDFLTFIENNS